MKQNQGGSRITQKQNGNTHRDRRRCPAKTDYPLCADDDWVSKCPSGCRLQGSMSQLERQVESRMRKVCERLQRYQDAAAKAVKTSTHIYNFNRQLILNRYVSELKYMEDAEKLAGNLTSLRKRSSALSRQLGELHGKVQKQVEDMYKTEVDIDMKLRACRGSCRSALPFSVDHPSYKTLQTHMNQLQRTQRNRVTPLNDIPHVKLQHVDIGPVPSEQYKTNLLTQIEDMEQNKVVLEEIPEELLEDSLDVEVLELPELE
ncbi:fibrinogen alpha chain [Polymixia lowei]